MENDNYVIKLAKKVNSARNKNKYAINNYTADITDTDDCDCNCKLDELVDDIWPTLILKRLEQQSEIKNKKCL